MNWFNLHVERDHKKSGNIFNDYVCAMNLQYDADNILLIMKNSYL